MVIFMDRYAAIKNNLLRCANEDDNIQAIVLIGSSTRNALPADVYSDLDVIIVTNSTENWLYQGYPEKLGDLKISFVEPTLGGGKERRVLYGGSLDVDMIIFTPEQFVEATKGGVSSWVMNRGYEVLYDAEQYSALLEKYISTEISITDMSESEYVNMVNDFFFHIVWASKKVLRGELWSAKMCVDAYLKNYLLKMIEVYSASKYHTDVWHDGRFLDRWAEESIRNDLKKCFAHYDKEDIIVALSSTMKLFGRLAGNVADMKGYAYPETADEYATSLFKEYFKEV